jgi:hypothetical protein
VLVLSVILPEADWTDFVSATFGKGPTLTAGAAIGSRSSLDDVLEAHGAASWSVERHACQARAVVAALGLGGAEPNLPGGELAAVARLRADGGRRVARPVG